MFEWFEFASKVLAISALFFASGALALLGVNLWFRAFGSWRAISNPYARGYKDGLKNRKGAG